MAVNEEARARRLEWRAGVLRYATDDDRKQQDAAIFEKAARLFRRVGELRPAFNAASDKLTAEHHKTLAAWYKGGREGDKPTLNDAMWGDRDVLEFRAARQDVAELLQNEEYRGAVLRTRIDDFSEPSDDELLKGKV